MKTVIIGIILMITIGSCNQIDNKKVNSNTIDRFQYDDSQKLIHYLNDFIEKDTTITNNNETLKDNSIRLKKELNELFKNNDSLFYQLPLKLSEVIKINGEYYGSFLTISKFMVSDIQNEDKGKRISKGSNKIERISSLVMVKLNNEDITTLKEGNYYKVIGKFNSFMGNCIFKNRQFNSNDCNPKVEKGIWNEQLVSFDLGLMYIESTQKLELTEPKIRGVDFNY